MAELIVNEKGEIIGIKGGQITRISPFIERKNYTHIGSIRGARAYLRLDPRSGIVMHGTGKDITKLTAGIKPDPKRRHYTTVDHGNGWFEVK